MGKSNYPDGSCPVLEKPIELENLENYEERVLKLWKIYQTALLSVPLHCLGFEIEKNEATRVSELWMKNDDPASPYTDLSSCIPEEKAENFVHLISCDHPEKGSKRLWDPRRTTRLHWIYPFMAKCVNSISECEKCPHLYLWKEADSRRNNNYKYYFLCELEAYVVILAKERKQDRFHLVTAYHLGHDPVRKWVKRANKHNQLDKVE